MYWNIPWPILDLQIREKSARTWWQKFIPGMVVYHLKYIQKELTIYVFFQHEWVIWFVNSFCQEKNKYVLTRSLISTLYFDINLKQIVRIHYPRIKGRATCTQFAHHIFSSQIRLGNIYFHLNVLKTLTYIWLLNLSSAILHKVIWPQRGRLHILLWYQHCTCL